MPDREWDIVVVPCAGCGADTRYPRNYPGQRLCLTCMTGLLPEDARAVAHEMLEMFGLAPKED